MQSVNVNGVDLEYEVTGAGEPVLLISPVIADGFLPLLAEPALADRYQLIRYHKRGWVGSTHTPPPVSIADHADDAAALLDHLGLRPAHIAGHSSGAAVAAQLALDHPEYVHTLMLLEPSLISVPSLGAFFTQVEPALEAYASGDHAGALAIFMSAVSGLEWTRARAVLEETVPGAVEQAISGRRHLLRHRAARPDRVGRSAPSRQPAPSARPVRARQRDAARVGGGRRVPPLRAAAGRRMHDRRRGPPAADPASRARRSGNGGVPRPVPHRRRRTRSARASVTEPCYGHGSRLTPRRRTEATSARGPCTTSSDGDLARDARAGDKRASRPAPRSRSPRTRSERLEAASTRIPSGRDPAAMWTPAFTPPTVGKHCAVGHDVSPPAAPTLADAS